MSFSQLSSALSNLKQHDHSRERPVFSVESFAQPTLAPYKGRLLTEEQEAIIKSTARVLSVNAYAGCAKTTTLIEVAHHAKMKSALYLAYNKAIAQSASQSFQGSARCKTSHSLALSWLKTRNSAWCSINPNKLMEPSLEQIRHSLLGSGHWQELGKETLVLRALKKMLHTYSCSAQDHLSLIGLSDLEFVLAQKTGNLADSQTLSSYAQQVWELMLNPHTDIGLGHDGYLKAWSLSTDQIASDLIMIDESQDSNPALLRKLQKQTQSRLIYVGDEYQAIYSFRGAVDALRSITSDEHLSLTRSFRFGPEIAQIANGALLALGASRPIIGKGSSSSICLEKAPIGRQVMFISRTNAGLFEKAAHLARNGKKIFFPGDKKFNLDGIDSLIDFHETNHSNCSVFENSSSFSDFYDKAIYENDRDTILKCSLVEEYGRSLTRAIALINKQTAPTMQQADGLLCTAHKSKGLESDWVEIGSDFWVDQLLTHQYEPLTEDETEEAHVLYVALTRARKGIHLSDEKMQKWAKKTISVFSAPHQSDVPQAIRELAAAYESERIHAQEDPPRSVKA